MSDKNYSMKIKGEINWRKWIFFWERHSENSNLSSLKKTLTLPREFPPPPPVILLALTRECTSQTPCFNLTKFTVIPVMELSCAALGGNNCDVNDF